MSSEVVKPPGFVWTWPAYADYAHDGDTIICHVMLHPNDGGEAHDVNVRIEGINSPELNTSAGKDALDYAEKLLDMKGRNVVLVGRRREKYGRFLAHIVFPDGSDFGELMIAGGHAVPYLA